MHYHFEKIRGIQNIQQKTQIDLKKNTTERAQYQAKHAQLRGDQSLTIMRRGE